MKAGENVLLRLNLKDDANAPIPLSAIAGLEVSLFLAAQTILRWSYVPEETSEGMRVEDGLAEVELVSEQSINLKGNYGVRVKVDYTDTDYFFTGKQTDVVSLPAQLLIELP